MEVSDYIKRLLTPGLAIWNWFVSMFGASMVERLGRRKLFMTSGLGMLAAFILILGLAGGYDASKNPSMGIALVPFIFVFMGFYSFGMTPLPMLYTPEIVPLALRAKAFTILAVTQNTSNTFNQ
jgi:MFS family permease